MTNFFSLSDLGLSQSSSQLLDNWLTQMQESFPGFSPSAAGLEYIQAQIFASMAADLATLCSNGATELFRTYATTLVGVPYQQGVAAQAVISITAQATPSIVATTSQVVTSGTPIVGVPVVALPFGITAGPITITDPTNLANTESFTTSGVDAGGTIIPVTIVNPANTYPVGALIGGTQQYVLDALSQFSLDTLGFVNLTPLTISAGTIVSTTLTAVQTGVIFNGAGAGGSIQSIQQLSWIADISLGTTQGATGGQDPEDDNHYLDRVKLALQLQAPRPITASDFGTMALNFFPYPGTDQQEVGRATAIDGYNPVDQSTNNTRMVAVAVTDTNGFALNNDTLYGYPNGSSVNIISTKPDPNSGWGIAGWLESLREINFIVNVINPTYSPIYVTVQVKAASGWDSTSVKLNVQSALLSYLSPPAWGLPVSSELGWQNATVLYQSALMSVIHNTPGVAYVYDGTLKFGLAPGPTNTLDLTLPGPIALPTSSSSATIPIGNITVI